MDGWMVKTIKYKSHILAFVRVINAVHHRPQVFYLLSTREICSSGSLVVGDDRRQLVGD